MSTPMVMTYNEREDLKQFASKLRFENEQKIGSIIATLSDKEAKAAGKATTAVLMVAAQMQQENQKRAQRH